MAECRQDCEASCVAVCGIEVCLLLAAEMGRAVIIIGMHAFPAPHTSSSPVSALLPYSLSLFPSSPDLPSSLHLPHPLGLAFLSPAPYPFSLFCSFRARSSAAG